MTRWRRPELVPGIYDEVVTSRLRAQIDALPAASSATVEAIAKSSDITAPIAATLRDVVDAALDEHANDPGATLALAGALLEVAH